MTATKESLDELATVFNQKNSPGFQISPLLWKSRYFMPLL